MSETQDRLSLAKHIHEMADLVLDPMPAKGTAKAVKAVKEKLKQYSTQKPLPDVTVENISPNEAKICVDIHRWHRPKDIIRIGEDIVDAIESSDKEGYIYKIVDGDGVGPEFCEALLSGLRPGMKLRAEAFFPYLEYVVTWKKMIKKGSV